MAVWVGSGLGWQFITSCVSTVSGTWRQVSTKYNHGRVSGVFNIFQVLERVRDSLFHLWIPPMYPTRPHSSSTAAKLSELHRPELI